MKHLIAIFSVILTLGMVVPGDVWAAKLCLPASCNFGSSEKEKVTVDGVIDSNIKTGDCFSCDSPWIGEDRECAYNDVIITNNGGHAFRCVDVSWTVADAWFEIDMHDLSTKDCGDSPLRPDALGNANVIASWRLANSRTTSSPVKVAQKVGTYDKSVVCLYLDCEPGHVPAPDHKSCVSANNEGICTNSGGQWDGSKCLCNGDGQTYDVTDVKCKCATAGYIWVGTAPQGKCVDPNATQKENCDKSGGSWNSGACECTAAGMGGPNGDGMCYCTDTNKTYNGSQCVDSDQVVCTNSGGDWDFDYSECTCDANKNIAEVSGATPMRCECISDDYEWQSDKKNGCKLTDVAKRRDDSFNSFKSECEKWGGVWSPDDVSSPDARDTDKWKCDCWGTGVVGVRVDGAVNDWGCKCAPGYVQPLNTYECKLSDYNADKQNCNEAKSNGADVRWVDDGSHSGRYIGHCECTGKDKGKSYVYSMGQCIDSIATQWCQLIPGAIIGMNGECVCKSTGQKPVQNKCPATNVAKPAPANNDNRDVNKKKQAITDILKQLNEISDGFGRSHWKNANGGFNTARLASDSVAGVVLGTVGGVVTSNIIKKNQVRGGFENINCTVGGQNVAGYGDQFQVGIQ